jgi:hypothetical protein
MRRNPRLHLLALLLVAAPLCAQQPGAPEAPASEPSAADEQTIDQILAGEEEVLAGEGYRYDPAGRRDPFISLAGRGGDLPLSAGARPAGVPGLLISEVTLKGVFKSRTGFIALVQSPDNRTYIIKAGDKVFDGSVKTITQDAVVFSQDVNDPLSLVKQREVRKAIRPEAR